MAENDPLTPEKQLLRLIENPKQASVRVESAKREGRKWFSFPALKGRLDFWKNFTQRKKAPSGKPARGAGAVERINLVLKVLCAAVIAYTVYSTWGMVAGIQKASQLILAPGNVFEEKEEPAPGLQRITYYLEKIRGRNILSPVKVEKKPEVEKAPLIPDKESPIRDLTLVGIAWSDDPEAMIEDKKSGRTFFVKRGQALAGDFQIVTIFKDKVILHYQDKEYELV